MALTSMPYLTIQESDANGVPYAGAKMFFYKAGTSTKLDTYSDATGATPNTNPVILDAAGRATVFFQAATYDVVLTHSTDSDPPVSPYWTRSGIAAVPASSPNLDITGTAGESISAGEAVYMSDGSGSKVAGKWYLTDSTNTYSSSKAQIAGMAPSGIAAGASGYIRLNGTVSGLAGLTAGTVYYATSTPGSLTASAPTNALVIGVADSTTSLIVYYRPVVATASVPGIVSIGAQTFGGVKTLTTPILAAPAFSSLPTGIGAFVTSYAASDTTKNNNTTLVNVTGLSFAVAASASYVFTFMIHGKSTTVANWKVTLTGPAAPTAIRFGAVGLGTTAGGAAYDVAAFSSNIVVGSLVTTDMAFMISGQLRNGANSGTVQFQFAQNTGEVSDTVVYAESSVMAWRVA